MSAGTLALAVGAGAVVGWMASARRRAERQRDAARDELADMRRAYDAVLQRLAVEMGLPDLTREQLLELGHQVQRRAAHAAGADVEPITLRPDGPPMPAEFVRVIEREIASAMGAGPVTPPLPAPWPASNGERTGPPGWFEGGWSAPAIRLGPAAMVPPPEPELLQLLCGVCRLPLSLGATTQQLQHGFVRSARCADHPCPVGERDRTVFCRPFLLQGVLEQAPLEDAEPSRSAVYTVDLGSGELVSAPREPKRVRLRCYVCHARLELAATVQEIQQRAVRNVRCAAHPWTPGEPDDERVWAEMDGEAIAQAAGSAAR